MGLSDEGEESQSNDGQQPNEKMQCLICDKTFYSVINYEKHKKRHEPPGGFLCRFCQAPFCSEGELKQHRETVHETIMCRLCPATENRHYSTEIEYREHITVVHNGIDRQLFRCETCDAEYKTIGPYQRHVQYQCGKFKPFKCEQCPLTFATKYNLAQHVEKHSDIKKFCCSFCGKNFVQKGRLNEHERVHTGEKPYKCDVCGKCFAHRESLVTHTSLHTGIRLLECRCCSSRFSCYSNLIKHRRCRPDTCGQSQYDPPKKTTRRISRIPGTVNPTSEIRVIIPNKVIKPTDKMRVQEQKKKSGAESGMAPKLTEEEKLERKRKREEKAAALKEKKEKVKKVDKPVNSKNKRKKRKSKKVSTDTETETEEEDYDNTDDNFNNNMDDNRNDSEENEKTFEPITHVEIKIENEENLFNEKDKLLDSLLNDTSRSDVAKDGKTLASEGIESVPDLLLKETEVVLIKDEDLTDEEFVSIDKVEPIFNSTLEEVARPHGNEFPEMVEKSKTPKKSRTGKRKKNKKIENDTKDIEESSNDPLNLRNNGQLRVRSKRACKKDLQYNQDIWAHNAADLLSTSKSNKNLESQKKENIEQMTSKTTDNQKENLTTGDSEEIIKEETVTAKNENLHSKKNKSEDGITKANPMEEDNLTLAKLKVKLSSTSQEKSKNTEKSEKNEVIVGTNDDDNTDIGDNGDADNDEDDIVENDIEDPLCPKRKNKPPQREKNLSCTVCNKIYHSQKPYEKHLLNQHLKSEDEVKEILLKLVGSKEDEKKKQLDQKCHICGSTYLRKLVLKKHLEKHGPNGELKTKCPCRCGTFFANLSEATAHAQEVHRKDLYCALCDKFMKTKNSLRQHFRKNCPHLVDDDNSADRYPKFICDKCGKQFTSRTSLNDHVRSDCGRWPAYVCKVCGKQLTTAGILRTHMLLHKDDTPFKCDTCGKTFKVKAQYKEHMRFRHTGYKPFKCHFCPKAYPYRESLMIHMTVHTGIKRFACNYCGKRFTCISNLQAHRKVNANSCGQYPLDARPTLKMGVQKGNILYGGVPDTSFAAAIPNSVPQ